MKRKPLFKHSFLICLFLFAASCFSLNAQDITFTWKAGTEAKSFFVSSPAGNEFTVDWGDESKKDTLATSGDVLPKATAEHTYTEEKFYTVTITANEGDSIKGITFYAMGLQTLRANSPTIDYIKCDNNELTLLNVRQCPKLNQLICGNNKLTTLDVSSNELLTGLSCRTNELTVLDLSKNKNLESLDCQNNKLINLTFADENAVKFLWCDQNKLKNPDVTELTSLEQLYCTGNEINSLDVTKNTELLLLDVRKNQLTDIDLSKNTKLKRLNCSENKLNGLDLTNNDSLTEVGCYINALPLSTLLHISEKVDEPQLGSQSLASQYVLIDRPITITADLKLNETATVFTVKKGVNPATEGTDYTLTDGKITFKVSDIFTIEMTNKAIVSDQDYPAVVRQTYNTYNENSIEVATVAPIDSYTYTGQEIKPQPEVKYEETALVENTDYMLSYAGNTDAGTATVTITGTGTYTGVKTVAFEIEKAVQTITFEKLEETELSLDTITPNATATSGLTVTYTSSNEAIASITDKGEIVLHAVGEVKITAVQNGDNNYLAAEPVPHTLTIVDSSTSVEIIEKDILNIYPNPVVGTLYIDVNTEVKGLTLYDMSGKIIMQSNTTNTLNMNGLQNGMYLLKVVTTNGETTRQIIKK